MSNQSERVRTLFSHDIESKIQLVDTLSDRIAQAGQCLVDCLLTDGKILVAGQGGSAANCLHFSTAMLGCFEAERPSLPVINLAGNGAAWSAITDHVFNEQLFAQQIQAFGQAGDVVIVLSTSGQAKVIHHVIPAAHEKRMKVIALTGRDGGGLGNQLHAQDIELCIPGQSSARIREMHLFMLHCFCDVIERSLFGCNNA